MESLEKVADENFVPSDKKKKVGSYVLGRTIGEGSFAKVRQGFHIIAKEKVRNTWIVLEHIIEKAQINLNVQIKYKWNIGKFNIVFSFKFWMLISNDLDIKFRL